MLRPTCACRFGPRPGRVALRRALRRSTRTLGAFAAFTLAAAASAQQPSSVQDETPIVTPIMPEQVVENPTAPCLQPAPPVSFQDYQGPFAKTAGLFAQRLERKSVLPASPHHYKPGAILCTLEIKDKFWLFVRDTADPVAFLSAAADAGLDQAQDYEPSFGQGFAGYGKRVGADMATQASAGFFKDFLYPTIFNEDPRFYRLGSGSARRRIFHAATHVAIAHTEHGRPMFNISEFLGDATVIVLSNTYLPDNRRGVAPVAIGMATTLGTNAGYDILREYWPEIARKCRLPFKGQPPPAN